jgi:AcrR family transcriptional regulator
VTGPDPEDLTARARIRDAALRHFGERGFDKATIREIAETAGVSSGLVRHHFGSKQALREACDEYLSRTIQKLNDQARADTDYSEISGLGATRMALWPYQPYISRALVEGSASALFDQIVDMCEDWMGIIDQHRADPPDLPRRARATVFTAMALGVPVLQQHVSRGMGVDLDTPEGDHLLSQVLLDIYSHPAMSTDDAKAARTALDRDGNGETR